jgi:hypothetical protein
LKIYFLVLLISFSAFGAPREIEVWFLSNAKTALLEELLNKPIYSFYSKTAKLQCQEVGDYCFDPQYGLYKKDDASNELIDANKIEKEGPAIPSGKSLDRDMISCDKSNYFDIFCGKARGESKSEAKLDIWIDTSSSMREFDYSQKDGSCYRKTLVSQLDETCGFNKKVNVMMFDTTIKQAGTIDQLCMNQGLNDYKRLMDWIERSEAKKLIVITDIYELHKEFADFIEKKNGKILGDKDPLTAKEVAELANSIAKSCR